MRINLIPLYAWYVLVAAAMILFAFPPLIAGSMLLEIERAFGWPFFNPAGGGDPLLWQHLFWLFGHPEVYIIFLPSVALIAMIVPTFARRPIVGYTLDRAGGGRHGLSELRAVGASHVHDGAAGHLARVVLGGFGGGGDPDGRADFLLHRHARGGARRALGADAVRLRQSGDLRARRA